MRTMSTMNTIRRKIKLPPVRRPKVVIIGRSTASVGPGRYDPTITQQSMHARKKKVPFESTEERFVKRCYEHDKRLPLLSKSGERASVQLRIEFANVEKTKCTIAMPKRRLSGSKTTYGKKTSRAFGTVAVSLSGRHMLRGAEGLAPVVVTPVSRGAKAR